METAEAKQLTHFDHIQALAEAQGIKPLKGKETVTYYPIGRELNPTTGRLTYPATVEVKSKGIMILHPATEEAVPLEYVASERPIRVNGRQEFVEERPNIYIEGGQMVLSAKDIRLYYHMELSDQNASKKNRDESVQAKFYRADKVKDAKDKIAESEIEDDANRLARTMPFEEAKEYAVRLKAYDASSVGSVMPEEVRASLLYFAKQNPRQFIKDSRNARGMAKLHIAEAKAFKIITHDEINWEWTKEQDPAKKVITKVNQNLDPIDGLVLYFLDDKDGKKAYTTLKNKLKNE